MKTYLCVKIFFAGIIIAQIAHIYPMEATLVSSLHASARQNLTQELLKIFLSGENMNARNAQGFTALHLAARAGHKEAVALLLAYDVDCTLLTNDSKDAYTLARDNGHNPVAFLLELYHERSADNNEVATRPASIVGNKHTELTPVNSSALTKHDVDGTTALHRAAGTGNREATLELMRKGFDVNARNNKGGTPLHAAAYEGHHEICLLLLEHNAEKNLANNFGNTALHLAAIKGHRETAIQLIEAGLSVYAKNTAGNTVLDLDSLHGHNVLTHYRGQRAQAETTERAQRRSSLVVARPSVIIKRGKAENATIDKIDKKGLTPLLKALKNKSIAEARKLVEEGANVTLSGKKGMPPLHMAAKKFQDCREILSLLLQAGADPNALDKKSNTPLHIVLEKNWIKKNDEILSTVQLLVSAGAQVDMVNKDLNTPLHLACFAGDSALEVITLLLASGDADIDRSNKEKYTPLSVACSLGDEAVEVVALLVKSGANIQKARPNEFLARAQKKGKKVEEIRKLITPLGIKNPELNEVDKHGKTQLEWAAFKNDSLRAQELIDSGADVCTNNPLAECITFNYIEMVALLLDNGADVNKKNQYDRTPLIQAAQLGHRETIDVLLSRGADPSMSVNGKTAYDEALIHGRIQACKMLEKYYDFTQVAVTKIRTPLPGNEKGLTALHEAVREGKKEDVAYLLDHGFDPNVIDKEGSSCLHYLAKHESLLLQDLGILIQLLLDKGAALECTDGEGVTPLLRAVLNKQEIVEVFCEKGANVNSKSKHGDTALHFAIIAGRKSIVEYLLTKGADVLIANGFGETPTKLAKEKPDKDIRKIIAAQVKKASAKKIK